MVSAHVRWGKRLCAIVAQSQDHASVLRNLKIGAPISAQSQDSENAQRNLQIAQILRL